MLNRLLRKQLLDLPDTEELKRRLNNAVEEESEVNEQGEAYNLQPLERLPAETERNDPNEEGSACIDSRTRGGADTACHGQSEEVEAPETAVSISKYL